MIKFEEFVQEAKDEEQDLSTKKAIVNFIAANLFRFANKTDGDTKGLMLLVASDDATAINTARRLATAALIARKGN